MKILTALLLSTTASAQVSATLSFGGVGASMTVNPNAYNAQINGIESVTQGCTGLTLASQVTSASTSFVLNNPNGCTILPGMGLGFGCAAGGGSCTGFAMVLAAGCVTITTVACPVVQGQFGAAKTTVAALTPVTLTTYGSGEMYLLCGPSLHGLQAFVVAGVTPVGLPNAAFASAAVAAQNATIATASTTAIGLAAASTSCVPAQ